MRSERGLPASPSSTTPIGGPGDREEPGAVDGFPEGKNLMADAAFL